MRDVTAMPTRKRRWLLVSAPASAPASGPGRGRSPGLRWGPGLGLGRVKRRWGWLPWRDAAPLLGLLCALVAAGSLGVLGQGQTAPANLCPVESDIAPCRCNMRGEEIQIWCSHSELPSVLAALRNVARIYPNRAVDELILENNAWPSLGGSALAGPTALRVSRLMLRDNGLETVAATWLAGLEDSLLELFLVEPLLRAFPDDSLLPFKRLEAVTLQCGEMQSLPRLAGLPRLRYVQVQSAMLWEMPPGHLAALPFLEQLHVVSSPRLASLDAGTLSDLPRLSSVNITDSGLTWMHPRALQHLPSLAEVHLRGNKLSDAAMVGRALHDLPALATLRLDDNAFEILPSSSFADLPALRELVLAGNRIIELQHGAFQRLPALRTLDLSRNQVRVVHPEAFLHRSTSGLEQLYLQENALDTADTLRAVLEALPRLRFLDVSDNRIVELGLGSLGRGHSTLERLHLDRNRIRRVFRDSFNNMPALRELRLAHNQLNNNLDQPYWNLPALKGLDLSYNQFRRCDPRLLANLPSLRRLDLSGNNIAHVDPASFLNTAALEHVNLSSNALTTLSPATFRTLLNLFELDLGRNRLSHIVQGLPPGLEYLRLPMNQVTMLPPPASPDLNLPALRFLDLSNNGLKRLPPDQFRQMPGLQQLVLSGNALQSLETGALSGLNRLERLEMRSNRISSLLPRSLEDQRLLRELDLRGNRLEVLPADVLQEASSLLTLDVSRNQLGSVEPDALRGNRNLEVFRAAHNALPNIPSALLGLSSLRVLDLSHNKVRELTPGSLAAMASLQELRLAKNKLHELRTGALEKLPRLQVVDLDSNELQSMQPRALHSLPALQQLNLARNRLQALSEGALVDAPALATCELQENQLVQVAPGALSGAPHLLHLNLSYNQLSALENAGLQQLRSLEILDLSHNRVSRVAASTLVPMEWLVELKMDNNRICNIQGVPFNNMPRLRVLSLKNNKMTQLPESTFQRLKHNVAQLELNGNPLSCSCDLLWLHSWLLEGGAGSGSAGEGPRCADGSLVREIRVSRAECDAAAKHEPLTSRAQHPSCDAEVIDLPAPTNAVLSTSQVVSTAMEVRGSTQAPQQNVAPSPEESEYFYDDYVEYQVDENATAINNASLVATTANPLQSAAVSSAKPQGSPVAVTPGPVPSKTTASLTVTSNTVGVGGSSSSHYIPGDTPTLYAGTNKNRIRPNTEDPKRFPPTPPPQGGLTFFGIPLKMPSLNIGGIFGHGRDADGKPLPARVGDVEITTPARGFAAPSTLVPTTTFSPGGSTATPHRDSTSPPGTASIVRVTQSGGFRPVAGPSASAGVGFTPIAKPVVPTGSPLPQLDIFRHHPVPGSSGPNRYFPSVDILSTSTSGPIVVTENYNFRDGHEERVKQHHSSEENVRVRTTYQRQPGDGDDLGGPSLGPGFVTVVSIPEKDTILRAPLREDTSREHGFPSRLQQPGRGSASVSRIETPATSASTTTVANSSPYTFPTTTVDPAVEIEQAVIYNLGELNGRNPTSAEVAYADFAASTLSTTTEIDSQDWSTPPPFPGRGSALSALLAPGGQLPGLPDQDTQVHHSRSSVTRVSMSASALAPGPSPGPALDDPQLGPIPRSAKGPHYFYSEAPNNEQASRETHNWYYENYNRTNLQPYIGPGSEAYSRSASYSHSPPLLAVTLLMAVGVATF